MAALPWMEPGAVVPVRPSLAAFAVVLTMAMGLLTGLWPALRGSRADVRSALKESGALRGGEIALAVVLLTFAGLLNKSCAALAHSNLGYRTEGADVPGWRRGWVCGGDVGDCDPGAGRSDGVPGIAEAEGDRGADGAGSAAGGHCALRDRTGRRLVAIGAALGMAGSRVLESMLLG